MERRRWRCLQDTSRNDRYTAFVQGRFADAQIELERAYAQIEGNGQENMALCCDFLAWRLALAEEMKPHCSLERRRTELLRHHNAAWLNIWSGISAYYYALLGESEKIPPIFGEHSFRISICLPREDQ